MYAAKNGHLNCLEYAHRKKCPWGKKTCYFAAKEGHLDCFKFAVKNGCPWDKKECLKIAINSNKTLIVNYIKNLDC
jgi:hypothetical protein